MDRTVELDELVEHWTLLDDELTAIAAPAIAAARLRSRNTAPPPARVVDSLLAQAIGTVCLVPLAQSRHRGDRGCPRVSRWVPGRRG